jgi:hypothetical protein
MGFVKRVGGDDPLAAAMRSALENPQPAGRPVEVKRPVQRSLSGALIALEQAVTLAVDTPAAANWAGYTDEQRLRWAQWVAKPWTSRSRRERLTGAVDLIAYPPDGPLRLSGDHIGPMPR